MSWLSGLFPQVRDKEKVEKIQPAAQEDKIIVAVREFLKECHLVSDNSMSPWVPSVTFQRGKDRLHVSWYSGSDNTSEVKLNYKQLPVETHKQVLLLAKPRIEELKRVNVERLLKDFSGESAKEDGSLTFVSYIPSLEDEDDYIKRLREDAD